jgi:hypothetical protein
VTLRAGSKTAGPDFSGFPDFWISTFPGISKFCNFFSDIFEHGSHHHHHGGGHAPLGSTKKKLESGGGQWRCS